MNAPLQHRRRLILATAIILSANPPTWAANPPWSGLSGGCNECDNQCSTCATSTGTADTPMYASIEWQIQVGLARYPKPTTYTDLAQSAFEKDGNLPNFKQLIGRYFPSTPFQQAQIPLKIHQAQISSATFHPSCLFLESEAIFETLKKPAANGFPEYIHQILTDDAFTLIENLTATPGEGFHISVWKRPSTLTKSGDYYDTTNLVGANGPVPLADVTFKRPDNPTDYNTLIYVQSETKGSAARTITSQIVQTLGTQGNDIGKPITVTTKTFLGASTEGNPFSQEKVTYAARAADARLWDYTITRDVFTAPVSALGEVSTIDTTEDPSPDLTSHTVDTYRDFSALDISAGGELGMKRLMSSSQSGQTTTYTYCELSDPFVHGRLETVTRPDGSWTAYTYAGMGTSPIITEYSSWLDVGIGNKESARKIETEVDGASYTEKTFIGVQLVAKSTTTVSIGTELLVTTRQWDGTGSDPELAANNSLATATAYYLETDVAAKAGRISRIEHSDGTVSTYNYSGTPDNLTTTVVTGTGLRIETIHGLGNIPIAEMTTDIASTQTLESWTSPDGTDAIGRPLKRKFNNNDQDFELSTYTCCGLGDFRARDGSTTHYDRDPLKRVYRVETKATPGSPTITTTTARRGLTTTVTRGGVFESETTRSLDGLVSTTISASRNSNASGQRLITRTRTATGVSPTTVEEYHIGSDPTVATGWTEVSETNRYPDGQRESVTGDAVTDMVYSYAANSDNGGFITSISTLTSATTEEITKTYTDALGRIVKTDSPANGTTTYQYHATNGAAGARGKLSSVTDADNVTVSYGYNSKGERNTTTRTVHTGDDEPATQVTTVTRVVVGSVLIHSVQMGVSRHSSTVVSGVTVSETYQSISGLKTGTVTPAGATVTIRTSPASTTITTINPDGTQTVQTVDPAATGDTITAAHFAKDSDPSSDTPISSTTRKYDAIGRLVSTSDSRTRTTGQTSYSDFTESGTPLATTTPDGPTTITCDLLGRVTETYLPGHTTANPRVKHASYYATGQVQAQWGFQTYPIYSVYNEQGQLTELHTYRSLAASPVAANGGPVTTIDHAVTTWNYYGTTGLLHEKLDADGRGPAYTYTLAGRLETREWARAISTLNPAKVKATYSYTFGDLTAITYNDGVTPNVGITYDDLSRKANVTNGIAALDYTYATDLRVDTETITYTLPGQSAFTRVLDRRDRTYGRDAGSDLKKPLGSGTYQTENSATYTYSAATGRLDTSSGLSTGTFTYGYLDNSNLLQSVSKAASDGLPEIKTINTWETNRNVLLTKANTSVIEQTVTTISTIGYTVNDIGQRTNATRSGETTASSVWDYDSLGQLDSANSSDDNQDRGYLYDTIGNRRGIRIGQVGVPVEPDGSITPNQGTLEYAANALNQYTTIPQAASAPAFDYDGNMTTGPLPVAPATNSHLVWDAENRLIEVQNNSNSTIETNLYDALARRIANTAGGITTLFIYDGFNCIAEYTCEATGAPALVKTRLWGSDLSGSMQGAGGVGGLLTESHGTATFYPAYDGNGNVTEYLSSDGTVVAHFEYDPFGNLTQLTELTEGLAASFSYRFSTKPLDFATGLYYYGYRYYDPLTGRWPSRDPIEEKGGINLYGFIRNNGVGSIDRLGLLPGPPPCCSRKLCNLACYTATIGCTIACAGLDIGSGGHIDAERCWSLCDRAEIACRSACTICILP